MDDSPPRRKDFSVALVSPLVMSSHMPAALWSAPRLSRYRASPGYLVEPGRYPRTIKTAQIKDNTHARSLNWPTLGSNLAPFLMRQERQHQAFASSALLIPFCSYCHCSVVRNGARICLRWRGSGATNNLPLRTINPQIYEHSGQKLFCSRKMEKLCCRMHLPKVLGDSLGSSPDAGRGAEVMESVHVCRNSGSGTVQQKNGLAYLRLQNLGERIYESNF